MNSKLIAATVIALSTFGATAAFAGDMSQQIPYSTASSTTRAAVMSDFAKARANGTLQVSNETGVFTVVAQPQATTVTRAQVRMEGIQAMRAASTHDIDGYSTY